MKPLSTFISSENNTLTITFDYVNNLRKDFKLLYGKDDYKIYKQQQIIKRDTIAMKVEKLYKLCSLPSQVLNIGVVFSKATISVNDLSKETHFDPIIQEYEEYLSKISLVDCITSILLIYDVSKKEGYKEGKTKLQRSLKKLLTT